MFKLKSAPAAKPAPAKQWRNWYRFHRWLTIARVNATWDPGVHRGPDTFPSKEIAEQHAIDFIAAIEPADSQKHFEHLGAYPEGVTPRFSD